MLTQQNTDKSDVAMSVVLRKALDKVVCLELAQFCSFCLYFGELLQMLREFNVRCVAGNV